MNIENKNNIFWINDPSVFFRNGNYWKVIPSAGMTRIEQLNAVTLLCFYLLILFIILGLSDGWIQIPIIIIIFIIIFYFYFNFGDQNIEKYSNYVDDPNIPTETGFYDTDSNLDVKTYLYTHPEKNNKVKYGFNEFAEHEKKVCRKPITNNPFMNPTLNDFELDDPPEACNANDEDIKSKIELGFNEDLYRNVGDLFNIKNSQRQFYTVSVPANPPDQTAFANWLYRSSDPPCKSNQGACLRYEDLRDNRLGSVRWY